MNQKNPPRSSTDPSDAVGHFAASDQILTVTPHGRGLINDSFLVRRRDGGAFLLQRLNPAVFPHPEALIHNLRLVSTHLRRKNNQTIIEMRRQVITLLPTRQRGDCHFDAKGECWRALEFIENARSLELIEHRDQAFEMGVALGRFHCLVHDLPPASLNDPLPVFHVIPWVLARYQKLVAGTPPRSDRREQEFCHRFISQRREGAAALEQARARGILPERVIHGDPKLDNLLFDLEGKQALALIDLDTVKPGLTQYDIGDCLRSCCNRAGENGADPEAAIFDLDLAQALLSGYLQEMRALLTYSDFAYFYEAIRLISFELGVRFFSDYLEGNLYFKVDDPLHNLRRALNQFKLVESIESQERALRSIIKELT